MPFTKLFKLFLAGFSVLICLAESFADSSSWSYFLNGTHEDHWIKSTLWLALAIFIFYIFLYPNLDEIQKYFTPPPPPSPPPDAPKHDDIWNIKT